MKVIAPQRTRSKSRKPSQKGRVIQQKQQDRTPSEKIPEKSIKNLALATSFCILYITAFFYKLLYN